MSYLASLMQKKALMNELSEAQWQRGLFGTALTALQKSCSDLTQAGTDYEADSVQAKKLQARLAKLRVVEQQLEQQRDYLDLRIKQLTAEIDYHKNVINEGATKFFK